MSESVRDRWLSIGMSVLLHGTLVALLAIGWWHFRHPAPAPTPPIDATVVDARTLKGAGTAARPSAKPEPAPQAHPHEQPPPPVPQEGPPPPTPDEMAMREQAAREEAQHEAEAQQQMLARQQAQQAREQAQRKAQAEAEAQAAEQAAEAKKAEEAKAAAQARKLAAAKKLAQAKAEAKKKAARLAQEKKLAQERKLAEEKKLAEQRQLAAQRQAEAERAARVADLQQSLQEEERASVASGALASWTSQLESRIQQRWIRPPTARAGIDCVLNVSLVAGGDVTGVTLGQCNGDDAVRESIKNAVYAASPLPPPPNNIAFPHELVIEFKPTN